MTLVITNHYPSSSIREKKKEKAQSVFTSIGLILDSKNSVQQRQCQGTLLRLGDGKMDTEISQLH